MLKTECIREYTRYEGLSLANQNNRKLGVFDRKLEERHYLVHCYFEKYQGK